MRCYCGKLSRVTSTRMRSRGKGGGIIRYRRCGEGHSFVSVELLRDAVEAMEAGYRAVNRSLWGRDLTSREMDRMREVLG